MLNKYLTVICYYSETHINTLLVFKIWLKTNLFHLWTENLITVHWLVHPDDGEAHGWDESEGGVQDVIRVDSCTGYCRDH